jgi:hypothetical protein
MTETNSHFAGQGIRRRRTWRDGCRPFFSRWPGEMRSRYRAFYAAIAGGQTARFSNPSDNSLAVGLDHIFQIVKSRIAIFAKKGREFSETGWFWLGRRRRMLCSKALAGRMGR